MKYCLMMTLLMSAMIGVSQNVYDLKIKAIKGDTLDFKYFEGRQILIVNVASESEFAGQLDEMQQLYDTYRDSGLVVIAVPSNDFGKESKDDSRLEQAYKKYTFLLAAKVSVKGSKPDNLFDWLSKKAKNGKADEAPARDYKKYLINRKGELVATFTAKVNPLNDVIIEAIRNNN